MVGVEPPPAPARTPIGARLAARGVRPRKVSAKRSWPPGCGRFAPAPPPPEAGDGEKGAAGGVIDGRVEEAAGHAGVSSAACNSDLPPVPPQPETEGLVEEKKEGGGADIATASVSSAACNGDLTPAPPQPETKGLVEVKKNGGGADIATASVSSAACNGDLTPASPQPETKGLVEVKEGGEQDIATAAVSSPACNGSLPQALPLPETEGVEERKEGGEEQLPEDSNVQSSNGLSESMAIEVMPLAFAAPHNFTVAAVNGFVDKGGHGAEPLPMEAKGGLGSDQLIMEEDLTGNGGGGVMESRVDSGELEREDHGHDAVRKKRWLMSVVNPPPKRRAVSAIRKFPPGCGRSAVTATGNRDDKVLVLDATPISFATGGASVADALHTAPASGLGASPALKQDASNEEAKGKRAGVAVAETNKAHGKNQESHLVDGVVSSDFAGSQHDSGCSRNAVTKASPRHGFGENVNGKRPLHEGKHVALAARDREVRRKVEGSLQEGTTKSHGRGLVDAKTYVKRPKSSVTMRDTLPDDIEVSRDSMPRNNNSDTRRGNERSNNDMKQGIAKLKSNAIGKGSLNRKSKESKCGNHDAADQIEENDDLNFVAGKVIVQALMAPDKCPWTKGRKSIGSASSSLPPRSKSLPRRNNKKKDDTPRKELPPKPTPSIETANDTIEDQEQSCSEDDDASMALVVDERKKEFCVTLPPCAPSGDQSVDARSKAKKLLKLFQLICRKLMQAEEQGTRKVGRIDIEAVNAIKKNYEGYTKPGPIVGNVPGVDVGDEFHFRVELSIVGLHRPYQGGIDTAKVNGIPVAISIVASGGYPDELSSSDELIYTGSGGKAIGKKEAEDQELKRGNLALKNCIEAKTPVRVTHGFKGQSKGEAGNSKSKQVSTYTYDGLYMVVDCWQEGEKGSMVFKYKLKRIPGQPELALHIVRETRKSKVRAGLCCPDISQGKERIPICVINTIDDMQPAPFKYTTKVIYPPSYAKETPKGCECTNGCSDSSGCACAVKNGGEIPFNFNGAIVHAKPLIYECGPSCRCPPTCHNRVSQHGVKIPLEIFKTGETGWGVRSLSSISSGSFICEYGGQLLQDTEAEKTENDEYLFDIGHNYDDEELWKGLPSMIPGLESSTPETMEEAVGFTIDAAKCGNVGRFINHSCTPNLYAQNVLWDHDDKRMPHIMFFAAENIPPLQELTYHYNYTIGQVRDKNGEEKIKECLCGSSECCHRLY
ncbi:hypothetical protein QYE76_004700 [Lolium multiflorum]|uniref:Uncharacterized protein n=1 Tax=Lolium multiflorum TaxID=4521 RepID=A0AAD8RSN5_LOLMU|nr:hypothetical protein QYE76_004700 [Lolium multiflorum]